MVRTLSFQWWGPGLDPCSGSHKRKKKLGEATNRKCVTTKNGQQKEMWEVAGHEVREVDWDQILKGFECCSKELGLYPEGNRESQSF